MTNTKTIARNSGWFGLESLVGNVISLVTSIVIARTLGPTRMGYLIYVFWVVSVVSGLAGTGIPATTRKYMAEFLGKGDRGTARFIYFRTLALQSAMALAAASAILAWVLNDAAPGYRLASALIAISVLPSLVNSIPAWANVATENLAANVPASIASTLTYFLVVVTGIWLHWGVTGVALAFLLSRVADCLIRIIPATLRIAAWEKTSLLPAGIGRRMVNFAWQSVASMLAALIVWNRSEIFLLKHMSTDVRQIAFYSVAFGMGDKLLMLASIFGSAAGTTIFAQFGRDKNRLPEIAATSLRYLALLSFPLHAIAAALAVPAMMLLYGQQYAAAALVVTIAPLLCMPKAFFGPIQNVLESHEKQNLVIAATAIAGVADYTVAALLIPRWGAVGACIGSGAAQVIAVVVMWGIGIRRYHIQLGWKHLLKIATASAAAAATAFLVASRSSSIVGILAGGFASLGVLVLSFYVLGVVEEQDRARLESIATMLPSRMSRPVTRFVNALARTKHPPAETGVAA